MTKLPDRFVLIFEGEVHRVLARHNIQDSTLPHLIANALTGMEVHPDAFRAFGMRVTIEVDTDQGPD